MELISESPRRQTEKGESPPALTASVHIDALLNTKAIILHFRPLKLRAEQSGWVQENNTGKGQENMTRIRKMIHRGCNIFQMFAVDPKLARVTAGQFWRKQRTQRSQLQHTACRRERQRAYSRLHGTEISGTFMVAVVLCQVRWCQPIDVSVCWLCLIGQEDSAALTGGMRLIEK